MFRRDYPCRPVGYRYVFLMSLFRYRVWYGGRYNTHLRASGRCYEWSLPLLSLLAGVVLLHLLEFLFLSAYMLALMEFPLEL